jgi:endo-1,4-beta-xylanase
VIENFGDKHNPTDNSNHTCYGTFESDGGTYEVWRKWRVNQPSIIGTATFPQYWSVRTKRHVGGTINTTKHFEKWEKAGLPLGKQTDGMGESSLRYRRVQALDISGMLTNCSHWN